MGEKVFMQGNAALAESAIRAGCRFFFGYPITPSSEVPEYYARKAKDEDLVFVQGETEVAVFNMIAGTAATGNRVMTATSGPGFSLGQEAMSFMSAAGLPAVIVQVMRPGPADGEILAAQGDYFQAVKGGGHGDYNNLVLAPYSVQEMCQLIQECFELAEKYRNPVVLLSDALLAKMQESVELPGRKQQHCDLNWALTGCAGREHNAITTCGDGAAQWEGFNLVLQEKFSKIKANEERWENYQVEDAELVLVAYGSMARINLGAMKLAREAGLKVGLVRPISLWPFPVKAFAGLDDKKFLVTELSAGQMVEDVKLTVAHKENVHFYGRLGGVVPTPKEIFQQIKELVVK
ncbi:3-methyl-2-oxobutanoate dehydrogenase subunit VorB [Acetonema longum]|uniref:2-ketoisovalerate ferredoxin reductase n=1 Tax=Acetonema longum DSM 6540 TaxID=1009370 RepID=F7NMW7_9FIRM|nr:3-methyl-2-oxobutanoate dehydrogenase subunit VorB [Acetonema longum]EGO62611.1 2-ketoisovalerate ferredoxin reductase [Acetonema longum DSM 6540]